MLCRSEFFSSTLPLCPVSALFPLCLIAVAPCDPLCYSCLCPSQPTNDLDVDTLRSLEDALQEFDGAGVIVSHDRWFLDRVCTHILAFEEGGVRHCEGNFSDYEEMRKMTDRADGKGKKKKFKNITIDT